MAKPPGWHCELCGDGATTDTEEEAARGWLAHYETEHYERWPVTDLVRHQKEGVS